MSLFNRFCFVLTLFVLIILGCKQNSNIPQSQIKIGVFSPLYHPSLDAEIQGFREGLRNNGYNEGLNLDIEYVNGGGEFDKLDQLLETLYSKKKQLIFVVTTPAASRSALFCKKYGTPTVYGAVTDPVSAKIVESMDSSTYPICGVSDRYPVGAQCDFFSLFFKVPSKTKCAILFSPTEQNSQILSAQTDSIMKLKGFISERIMVHKIEELSNIVELEVKINDMIIVNGDNAIAEKMSLVSSICQKYKKPLFIGDPLNVTNGALAALGPNYYSMGIDAAAKAVRILKGEKAGSIPSTYPTSFDYAINSQMASVLPFQISDSVWSSCPVWKSSK